MQKGLELPRQESSALRHDLACTFVKLSGAVRDFTIDLTISRYRPDDARCVRNLIQCVSRGVLSVRPETTLFDIVPRDLEGLAATVEPSAYGKSSSTLDPLNNRGTALSIISGLLAAPTRELTDALLASLKCADKTLMQIGGVKKSAVALQDNHGSLPQALERLQASITAFDAADEGLCSRTDIPHAYASHPEIIGIFLFVHPVRQVADKALQLIRKVIQMQQSSRHRRFNLPSYPFAKSLNRVNSQVRHDRGGLTAGFYFRSKKQLEKTMADMQSTSYVPRPRSIAPTQDQDIQIPSIDRYEEEMQNATVAKTKAFAAARYRLLIWRFLHRLQGFESRFAFKVSVITTLLSIPAWLQQSQGWWNTYESWWAVVTVWIMMHPRVGGTFQDLGVRSLCAILGVIWAGFGWAAGNGNPYVLAVFAAIFMFPMLHRFTRSSHPRSGMMGCVTFTVVSLGAYTNKAEPSLVKYTWTRGVAFLVGIFAALFANWVLWPFVARHELRKSLSTLMLHSAILYRGVVARYIYYAENNAPGPGKSFQCPIATFMSCRKGHVT